jgi:hypothetical protein
MFPREKAGVCLSLIVIKRIEWTRFVALKILVLLTNRAAYADVRNFELS